MIDVVGLRVAMVGGGVGASRLAIGLSRVLEPGALTCIVNTGDDHWRYGLRVCPDLDTNLYALAGVRDELRGWGIAGDTFRAMERLRALGDDPWFALGDLDLATHLLRTELLRAGKPLSEVTAELARRAGLRTRLIPMTDDEVETWVRTADGELSFEEYFVRREARVPVAAVVYRGIETATPAPGVVDALRAADVVVIGPSNPVTSLGPVLAIPGLRAVIEAAAVPVVAVTPIVSGISVASDGDIRRARARSAQLATWGLEHRAAAVALRYAGLADAFVLDAADEAECAEICALGLRVEVVPTLARTPAAAELLARAVLNVALPARSSRAAATATRPRGS